MYHYFPFIVYIDSSTRLYPDKNLFDLISKSF